MDQFLAGKKIAVTASRRSQEQASAFERHGAQVLLAPTVRIIKTDDDKQLIAETQEVLAQPAEILLVTTGYGLRTWVESMDHTRLAAALRSCLAEVTIYVRGAKGRGAVRALGYRDCGMAETETTEALVDLALDRGVAGQRVIFQQHGKPDNRLVKKLIAAGAQVVQVHPNRWEEPEQPILAEQLVDELIAGKLDAITFTAAPAVEALLDRAAARGELEAAVAALKHIKVAAVGPVTAEPLIQKGINPLVPERFRMGAMVKELIQALREVSSKG